jgi:hypothetical protein
VLIVNGACVIAFDGIQLIWSWSTTNWKLGFLIITMEYNEFLKDHNEFKMLIKQIEVQVLKRLV